jgi:hypothetical protein
VTASVVGRGTDGHGQGLCCSFSLKKKKLLSLKYLSKCQKKLKMVVTLCFAHFSLCLF